jgi:NAD(P)-dependent dehydrogenase (short-subunit alcohol dehydrogenase family)
MGHSDSITDKLSVIVLAPDGGVNPGSCNAGITDVRRAHKMPVELVDAVLDTNVRGPYLLSCEFARRLIEAERRPGGSSVSMTSSPVDDDVSRFRCEPSW